MNIFQSRKLSDAEFVEKIRKQTESAKRRAWILLAFSILYLVLIVVIWCIAKKLDFFQMGFVGGCFVGLFAGVFLIKALMYFAFFLNHLFGYRKEKLLVAYYDQIHPLDAKAPAPSNISKL